jgi:O-antigen ligase
MPTPYLHPTWAETQETPATSWVVRSCLALFGLGLAMDASIGTLLGAGGQQSLATSIALAAPLALPSGWHLVTGGPVRRMPAPFLALTGFVAWCAVSVLWARHAHVLVSVTTAVQLLAFVWLGYQLVRSRRDLRAMLIGYVVGCCTLVVLTWRNYVNDVFVHWERFAADGFDPNDMAIYLALGIPMAAYLALSGSPGKHARLLWLLYLPLAASGVVLASSRTGTLATGMVMGAVILWLTRRSATASALTLMLLLAGVMVALQSVPRESFDRIFSVGREFGGSMGGRAEIWGAGMGLFANNPVRGVGVGGFGNASNLYVHDVVHNTPLSIAVELGLVGLVLFFGAFALAIRGVRFSGRNEKALVWCLFMTCFIGIQSLTWENRKPMWFLMLIAMVAAGIHPRPDSAEEE